jgi:hypothetical protein
MTAERESLLSILSMRQGTSGPDLKCPKDAP